MTEEEFEKTYHGKIVSYDDGNYSITGLCTAALYDMGKPTISILPNEGEGDWTTLRCAMSSGPVFDSWIKDFTVVESTTIHDAIDRINKKWDNIEYGFILFFILTCILAIFLT